LTMIATRMGQVHKVPAVVVPQEVCVTDITIPAAVMTRIGVRDVEAVGDSRLIVQQIIGESWCLDGVLNSYRDKC
jgi:hypothetical protein